jgi:hypothetical protein
MPFKGDMRLGGRHSNVASLNGTASDFGVPAFGAILSGPTDTSRNEADYAGIMFLMPYSTTVYADGLGGQNSVETWGLQYLPAGWRTGTGNQQILTTISSSNLIQNPEVSLGDQDFYYQEDGTGINYIGEVDSNNYLSAGTWIYGSGDYSWFSDGNGGYYETYNPPPDYPSYGTILGSGSGNLYFHSDAWENVFPTPPSCSFVIGDYSYTEYADGNGGSYTDGSDNYYSSGNLLGDCGDYTYYSAGGYSMGTGQSPVYRYFKQGYVINTYLSAENYQSYSYGTAQFGLYLSSATHNSEIADGGGGSSISSYSPWYPSFGTSLASGSYDTDSTDADGNPITTPTSFVILADGMGSYNIQYT